MHQEEVTEPNISNSPSTESPVKPTEKDDKRTTKAPCFNIPLIILNLSILNVFYISYFIFTAGAVRTIEKRFDLSSTQTGLMNSVEDIMQVVFCIFPSYVGLRMHKLRLLSGTMAIAGVGILMTNIPYILYGPAKLVPDTVSTKSVANSTISQKLAQGICVPGEEYTDTGCDDDTERNSNMVAYGIFILTNALLGIGTAATHALGTSYIDENTPTEQSPVYLGIFQAAKSLSPVIGSLMAAAVLKLPENLKDSVVDISSPSWIGAWWLGYTIIGSGILLMCIPLYFTPRHQPYYYKQQAKAAATGTRQQDIHKALKPQLTSEWIKNYIKRFFSDMRRLLSNKAFLAIQVSYIFFLYVIVGIFLNLGRYIEIHFRLSSSYANMISGVTIITSSVGTILGGLLMKRFRMSTPTAARVFVVTGIIGALTTVAIMFVSCDSVNMAGVWNPDSRLLDVNKDCAGNCSCSGKYYRPVCVNDELNYFSACHAGCLDTGPNGTYSDCSCVAGDQQVAAGQCEGPCSTLYIYVIIMALGSFISSLGKIPAIMVGLRVMDKDLKSLGLGIQTFLINLFTFIPGPLMYGAFFDNSCIVWKSSCGKTGNCLLYDTRRFRLLMHGPTAGFQMGAAIFAFITYLLIKDDPNIDSEAEEEVIKDKAVDGGVDNDAYTVENGSTVCSTRL